MNEPKITISFGYSDEFGNSYSQSSTVGVFHDLGERELDVIGEQLNTFLSQCGYIRKNDNILMEDLSDEEYEALADYLEELRAPKEERDSDD